MVSIQKGPKYIQKLETCHYNIIPFINVCFDIYQFKIYQKGYYSFAYNVNMGYLLLLLNTVVENYRWQLLQRIIFLFICYLSI